MNLTRGWIGKGQQTATIHEESHAIAAGQFYNPGLRVVRAWRANGGAKQSQAKVFGGGHDFRVSPLVQFRMAPECNNGRARSGGDQEVAAAQDPRWNHFSPVNPSFIKS